MELLVQQLLKKFEIVKEIVYKINKIYDENNLINEFENIEISFTINFGSMYVLLFSNDQKKLTSNISFTCTLIAEDFSNSLNSLLNKVINILKKNNIDIVDRLLIKKNKSKKRDNIADLQYLFNIFPWDIEDNKNVSVQNIVYNKCSLCGFIMNIDSNRSELCCENCGMVRELIGTIFDDTQFYNQENKSKSGTFNPNRHFQFWWSHILAKESEEELGDKKDPENLYGEKTLQDIKRIINRDHKILQLLTVNDIRSILREIEKTELNKNVPLILKKITGIGPPNVPEHLTIQVENLFTKAIEIGERLKSDKRINRNYYPYYIYRIIEALTTDEDVEIRRILYYIYIQSKETVEADDLDWEKICTELKEITYKPTDRTLGFKYCNT